MMTIVVMTVNTGCHRGRQLGRARQCPCLPASFQQIPTVHLHDLLGDMVKSIRGKGDGEATRPVSL